MARIASRVVRQRRRTVPRRLTYTPGGEVPRRRTTPGTQAEQLGKQREFELKKARTAALGQAVTAGMQRGVRFEKAEAALLGEEAKKKPYVRRGARISRELIRDVRLPGPDKYITRAESAEIGQRQARRETAAKRARGIPSRLVYQERAGGPRIDELFTRGMRGYGGGEGVPDEATRQQFERILPTALGIGQAGRIRGAERFKAGLEERRAALAPYAGAPQPAQPTPTAAPQPTVAAPVTTAPTAAAGVAPSAAPSPAPTAPLRPTPAAAPAQDLSQMPEEQLIAERDRAGRLMQSMEQYPGGPEAPGQAGYMEEYSRLSQHRNQLVAEQERRRAAEAAAQQQRMEAIPTMTSEQLVPLPPQRTWADPRREALAREIGQYEQNITQLQATQARMPQIAAAEAAQRYQGGPLAPDRPVPTTPITEGITGRALPRGAAEGEGFGKMTQLPLSPQDKLAQIAIDRERLGLTSEQHAAVVSDMPEGPPDYSTDRWIVFSNLKGNAEQASQRTNSVRVKLVNPPAGMTTKQVALAITTLPWYKTLQGSISNLERLRDLEANRAFSDPAYNATISAYRALYDEVQNAIGSVLSGGAPAPTPVPQPTTPSQARTQPRTRAVDVAARWPGFGG